MGSISAPQDPDEMRYWREQASPFRFIYDAARARDAELSASGRKPIFGGLLSKEAGNYGASTNEWEVDNNLGGVLAGLLAPVLKAFDAPSSAYQGFIPEQDLIPEVMGTAGLAMGGGAAIPSPAGSLRSGSLRQGNDTSNLFPDDMYHLLRGEDDAVLENDVFDTSRSTTRFDRLGTHVGTQKAAEDRNTAFFGDNDLAAEALRSSDQISGYRTAATFPLKVRTDKPFLGKDGQVMSEGEVRAAMLNYADQNNIADLDVAMEAFRKDLTDNGFTHVPYVNNIEGRGSVSAIMLGDRTSGDPAVIRSRFAEFKDPYSPNIMAANKSASGGLLSAAIGSQQKADAPFDMGGGGGAASSVDTRVPYSRSGSEIADRLQDIPSAKTALGIDDVAPAGMFTTIKAQQPNILREHSSEGFLSDELVAPTPTSISDYLNRTSMAIVGDNTGRHTVTGEGGKAFDTPVDSMAGFQYIDVPGQGYAGAQSASSSKYRSALEADDPFYNSFLMAERSGDFSQHVNDIYGQMFKVSNIEASDVDSIDSSIRRIGMSKIVKVLDDAGNVVKKPDGSAKTKSITVYPFEDFTSVKDPAALGNYLQGLPTGTQRAAFIKGMDKAGLHKMGVPKVADARIAAADPDQIGMDWGTVGYRTFTPDLEGGLLKTTPAQSTTYDTGIDKIGNSQTLLGQGSRGIPANLFYRDLAESQREKGTGGGLIMTSPDYKIYEGSPKRAQQVIDSLAVETIDTFLEMEKRFGREQAIKYANDVVSSGKVTSSVIEAARKANAPSWMIAALATSAGLLGSNVLNDGQSEEGPI